MRIKRIRSLVVMALFIYLPLQTMAWGLLGHRIVGEIADSYLTAKAKAEIRKILGHETIAMASNWADFIKSDSAYQYLNAWHYIDFPKGLSYAQMNEELKKDTATNAYTRLNFLIHELKKKNLSLDKKRMYLRLLIHIAGDIHQPLHVSPVGTMGGNDIRLTWFGSNSNLHRVWDEQMIASQDLSYTEYVKAINHAAPARRAAWQKQPVGEWLYESYTLSEQLHEEIREPGPKLSYRYIYDHLNTLNEQLLKGGVRLAGLLNGIFG